MVRLKPDKSSRDNQEFWQFVQDTTREVNDWPEWKRPNQPPQAAEAGRAPQPSAQKEKARD